MQAFARVFFQVGTHQAHCFHLIAQQKADGAALHHRNFKLADLVALGQIRIEIVFARKHRILGHLGAHGQAKLNGALHGCFVHHWQHTGQGQVHGASLRIGLGSESGAGTRENF